MTRRGSTCFLLALAVACTGDSGQSTPTSPMPAAPVDPRTLMAYFPPIDGSTWETIEPSRLGYDTAALSAALDWAGAQRTTAVVVVWRGRMVAERYWRGWTLSKDSIIASAGKSVLSALVESRITVRHLLGMMTGLDDSLKFVVSPGHRFYYNNPAYYQLFAVLQSISGQSINVLSRRLLFDRIGMSSATWRLNVDTGEPGWVLSCTARDMARFNCGSVSNSRFATDGSDFASVAPGRGPALQ